MKKLFAVAIAVLLLGYTGQASAAIDASITVSVTLAASMSFTLNTPTWNVGPVDIGVVVGPSADYIVTNTGTVTTKIWIKGANTATGWNIGAKGIDTFQVDVDTPPLMLTALGQALGTVAKAGTHTFHLTYSAPTDTTLDDGAQNFPILLRATRSNVAVSPVWS